MSSTEGNPVAPCAGCLLEGDGVSEAFELSDEALGGADESGALLAGGAVVAGPRPAQDASCLAVGKALSVGPDLADDRSAVRR